MIMPVVQIPINITSSFGFTALRNMIIDGSDNVVTAIIKLRIVPNGAPLKSSASAIGTVPKISAYIGTPIIVAKITLKGLLLPSTVSIQCAGIQL